MDMIWLLVGTPAASLLYTAYVIVRGDREKQYDFDVSPPSNYSNVKGSNCSYREGHRDIRWISTREFEEMTDRSDDVIFIDLRTPGSTEPLPHFADHALFITPSHLIDELQWIPSESSIVLYGASDSCLSMISTVRYLSGTAPVYVLIDEPQHSEVA